MSDLGRRKFLKSAAATAAVGVVAGCAATAQNTGSPILKQQGPSVMGLVVPKMDIVRVGFIGVGVRGGDYHVKNFLKMDGVEVKAICDTDQQSLDKAVGHVVKQGFPAPEKYTGSDYAYKKMLERQDIDVIIISTPWKWHAPMAIDAMESGKHALIEVPAATTIEECWQLVDTAERTQKNCMMLENVNYGRDELMSLNMVRQGLFGDLLHGEAAYIHELRWQMKEVDRKTGSWRTQRHAMHNGNLYPTHGLGPVAQYMNINRGDRLDYITSMSSPAMGRQQYAQREFPAGHQRNQMKYIAGDMNTSIIKTVKGRSIMVQHDTTTPRPYSRHNLIQGTNGVFAGFPNRIALENVPDKIKAIYDQEHEQALAEWTANGKKGYKPHHQNYHSWDTDMEKWYQAYDHPLWKRLGDAAKGAGHGGMDFIMTHRIISCLRNGEPLDQDVYDAAAWSSVFPLSMDSVADRSNSKTIPDFTRGAWKTGKPLGIVT